MKTLQKISEEKKVKIKNQSLGAEALDLVLARFAEAEGEKIELLPLDSSAEAKAEAFFVGADFYDHIHDHRHDWSTWRQDVTRARKIIFTVAERSKKR